MKESEVLDYILKLSEKERTFIDTSVKEILESRTKQTKMAGGNKFLMLLVLVLCFVLDLV